jgi:hypothetical protein
MIERVYTGKITGATFKPKMAIWILGGLSGLESDYNKQKLNRSSTIPSFLRPRRNTIIRNLREYTLRYEIYLDLCHFVDIIYID